MLVNQVQQFNADMVSAYEGAPQVVSNETSLRDTGLQYKNVASAIDGSVKFLSMIQQVANKAGQTGWFNDATYTDAQGGTIDLAKARTTSLAGMIDTARQLDALISGTIVTHLGDGQTAYGVINPGLFSRGRPHSRSRSRLDAGATDREIGPADGNEGPFGRSPCLRSETDQNLHQSAQRQIGSAAR